MLLFLFSYFYSVEIIHERDSETWSSDDDNQMIEANDVSIDHT